MTWLGIAFSGLGLLQGQEAPAYFTETAPPWWQPQGQLLLVAERIPAVPDPAGSAVRRVRSQLHLGWREAWGSVEGELAIRSALGSDGNAMNVFRYDHQPSNGSWLQRASLRFQAARPGGFGELVVGLQGNPLLSQESLWDHDLAVTGVGFRTAFRNEERDLQEAGLRGVAGRVRTFPNAAADLAALQGVLRVGAGGLDWTAHLSRWELRWDRGVHRFGAVPGREGEARQVQKLDAVGAAVERPGDWPWEMRGIQHRDPESGETGGEIQVWLGPRLRRWRPRLGLILQRFALSGTFMPLNGDEWWFTRGARGPRLILTLPMPGKVLLTLSHLEQTRDDLDFPVKRTALSARLNF